MASARPTIAFFGATGGCVGTALAHALKAGYQATALARNPDKLKAFMRDNHSVSATELLNLKITQGSIAETSAIRDVLVPSSPVSLIIFGIGGAPVTTLTPPFLRFDNPNICEEGMKAVLETLKNLQLESDLQPTQKPVMMAISTTGVSERQRDVPAVMYGLYHYILKIPHQDKKIMEDLLIAGASGHDAPLQNFTIVRPTLLSDGVEQPVSKIKAGWEYAPGQEGSEQAPGPELGYIISRASVGRWIFEEVIEGTGHWNGKCVSLCT